MLVAISLPVHGFADETQKHVSPDGKLEAFVIPVGKPGDFAMESRVEIRDSKGKIVFAKSFASKDGEHGYIVYHADWTPDSRFFVFSVYSSGGHQPWNSPIYFYCRSDGQLRLLDQYLKPVRDPHFGLSPPDIIRAPILKEYGDLESVTIDVKLSNLVKQKPKR